MLLNRLKSKRAPALRERDKVLLVRLCAHLGKEGLDHAVDLYGAARTSSSISAKWEGTAFRDFIKSNCKAKSTKELFGRYLFENAAPEEQRVTVAPTFTEFTKMASNYDYGFSGDWPLRGFDAIAGIRDESVLESLLAFLKFCNVPDAHDDSRAAYVLNNFAYGDLSSDSNTTVEAILRSDRYKERIANSIESIEKYLENTTKNLGQPPLEIPKERKSNKYYFANENQEIIGRLDSKNRLREFLDPDPDGRRILWFQIAGGPGQGKSLLALDLVSYATNEIDRDWYAGFLSGSGLAIFENEWADWQPTRPTLIILDGLVGHEKIVQSMLSVLFRESREFDHPVRILILERQRWSVNEVEYLESDELIKSTLYLDSLYDNALWFVDICPGNKTETLTRYAFQDGVEQLTGLELGYLKEIVLKKSEGSIQLSEKQLEETLNRVDAAGSPLFAFFLANELELNPGTYDGWRDVDILTSVLKREILNRWKPLFGDERIPNYRDQPISIKLAILATILRYAPVDHEAVRNSWGSISSLDVEKAISIASGVRINDFDHHENVRRMEPGILGEWFVLSAFDKGIDHQEIFAIACNISPEKTFAFLVNLALNFLSLPSAERFIRNKNLLKELMTIDLSEPVLAKSELNLSFIGCLTAILVNSDVRLEPSVLAAAEYAAEGGDNFTASILSHAYLLGRVVEVDHQKSIFWSEAAAETGNANAMCLIAIHCLAGLGRDASTEKAIEWLERAEEKGSHIAMCTLGLLYLEKRYGAYDEKKSFEWFRKSAEHGNVFGKFKLAVCYALGTGTKIDEEKAFSYYLEAANSNEKYAMNNLGSCYRWGNGTTKDLQKAIYWFRRASNLADTKAMINLGLCLQDLKVAEKNEEAFNHFLCASILGDSDAMFHLGRCYEYGLGANVDVSKAIKWYSESADLLNPTGLKALSALLQKLNDIRRLLQTD